jgi:DNA-binding CsgD family transcriptional regulator
VAERGAALHFRVAALVLGQWRACRQEHPRLALSLTPRELEVLAGLVRGDTTKAMAARLGIAHKTVESHRLRLFDKLGAKSQAHAVSMAVSLGLIPLDGPEPPGREGELAGRGRPERRGDSPSRGIWG